MPRCRTRSPPGAKASGGSGCRRSSTRPENSPEPLLKREIIYSIETAHRAKERDHMVTTVGYVGLGNMGGRLARRLQREHTLTVYDRSAATIDALVELGATAAPSAAAVAAASDIVFLCLPTSAHVRSALFDAEGVLAGAQPGTLIVDQTTGDPAQTRAMAAEVAERGCVLVDAPVSGGPMGADAGTIAIMVGAPDEVFARLQPILTVISPNVFHAGDVGCGHVIKLANNLLSAVHRAVSLEALALAQKNGVDGERALDILLASSGRNFYLETFVRSHVLSGKLTSGFTLELLHKDARLATQLGDHSGVPMFFGALAKEFYQLCINDQGPGAEVNNAALVMDRLAGTHLVPVNAEA
ncbi:NAD(P)-dependent oxidoreductase [Microbacterium sp. X-17]|uniref:NAD(P)-dependent oxidoreductase n=1 Tax=Microbacterium sp. X-17 TaxID=3144404 RepID=UPI0031F576AC